LTFNLIDFLNNLGFRGGAIEILESVDQEEFLEILDSIDLIGVEKAEMLSTPDPSIRKKIRIRKVFKQIRIKKRIRLPIVVSLAVALVSFGGVGRRIEMRYHVNHMQTFSQPYKIHEIVSPRVVNQIFVP
jgi:hypothetical protein